MGEPRMEVAGRAGICACGHTLDDHRWQATLPGLQTRPVSGGCSYCACTVYATRRQVYVPPELRPTPLAMAEDARRAARRAVEATAPRLREIVFKAIEAAGPGGLTADEVEITTGLAGNTVRPRLLELNDEHRIARAPRVRPTRSGRCAVVWVVEDLTP